MALLQQLKAWNHVVDGSESAAAFEAFEDRLWRRAFGDELPADIFRRYYQWAGAERLGRALHDRRRRRTRAGGTTSARSSGAESRDDIFLLAAGDAAADIGAVGERRAWVGPGARRHVRPSAGRRRTALAWFFNRGPVPVVGDGTTVMRISHRRLDGFRAWEHPSWRQVLDVGGWDNSSVVLPTGQSGHPLSPNYFDQNELWRAGQYRPLAFSRARSTGSRPTGKC